MSRRQLFTVTFLLVFLLLLWELGLILRPFFSPIIWAVILATTTYSLYTWLLARMGYRENVSAAIMTAGVLMTAVLPLYLASFGGLAYFGFLGLFLGPILLVVVLETFRIYQEEYQQDGNDIIIGVTTDSREDLRTAHELADKTV